MNENISKNIWQLLLGSTITSFVTFIFWYVVARITSTEAFGTLSVIVSFVLLLQMISTLQINFGVKRFLGKAVANNDYESFSSYSVSACILVVLMISITTIFLVLPYFNIIDMVGLDSRYTIYVIILLFSSSMQQILAEILISYHRTKYVAVISVIGSLLRFPVMIALMLWGSFDDIYPIIAYLSATVFWTIFLASYIMKIIPYSNLRLSRDKFRAIIKSSLPKYVPEAFYALSMWLGVILIYSLQGTTQTGIYYISLMILTISLVISESVNLVLHPKLSGIDNKQQSYLLTRSVFLTLLFTTPIFGLTIFYAEQILHLFGDNYSTNGIVLSILMINGPLLIISNAISRFHHAKGSYLFVFYIGVTQAVISVSLYFILVPLYSAIGATTAYTLGTLGGTIIGIIIAKKSNLVLEYKRYFVIACISFFVLSLSSFFGINFVIAFFISILISCILYIKIGYFTEDELKLIIYNIFSEPHSTRIYLQLLRAFKRIRN